jgi:hypothetical protein
VSAKGTLDPPTGLKLVWALIIRLYLTRPDRHDADTLRRR